MHQCAYPIVVGPAAIAHKDCHSKCTNLSRGEIDFLLRTYLSYDLDLMGVLRLGGIKLPSSKEFENMGKAIADIGKGRSCFAVQTIKEVKEALFKKGYEGAELYGAQLAEAEAIYRVASSADDMQEIQSQS